MSSPDIRRADKSRNFPVSQGASSQELALYDPNLNNPSIEDELDLMALWRVIVRYRKLIFLIFIAVVSTALITTLMKREIYTASSLIEINTAGRNIVKFQNLENEDIAVREHLSTQSQILASKAVAEEVIRRLNLVDNPELSGRLRQRTLKTSIKTLRNILKPSVERVYPEDVRMRGAVKRYLSRLSIDPIRKSNLINVRFKSFDPELSAQVVNEHLKAFIWHSGQRRFSSTSGAKEFLEKEIANVQEKLATSQRQLTEFARANGVVDTEDRSNIMLERLARLNESLSSVQNLRIDAETTYQQSQKVGPENMLEVFDDGVIKTLRQEQASLNAEYFQKSKIYKTGYPEMKQLRAKIDELENSIQSQVTKRLGGLKSSFEQLSLREARLKSELESFKAEMLNLQDRSVQYGILKRELDANKQLYAGLLERTKEVGVAAGMELNVGSVVDLASPPSSPSSPNLSKSLIAASLMGLALGLVVAFVLAMLDNTINDPDQLRKLTQLHHLGVAPTIDTERLRADDGVSKVYMFNTIAHYQPDSIFSEAMQSVRTSLAFMRRGGLPNSIMITSAVAGEGKSTIAMNLAVSCAKSGLNVVIVDADLRNSRYHDVFNVPPSPGLSDVLENGDAGTLYGFKEIKRLSLLVSGQPAATPVDLLGSKKMPELIARYEKEFDLVIVDCPPVAHIADAILVSTLVEAVLFVVAADEAPQDAVKKSLERLRMVNAPVIGTVLNNMQVKSASYSASYSTDPRFAKAS